jgi:hypothetical protein
MTSKPNEQLAVHQSNPANSRSNDPTKYDTLDTALPVGSPEPPPAEKPSRMGDLPCAVQVSSGCSVPPAETEAPVPLNALPHLPTERVEGGKGGEGGAVLISNVEFIGAVFLDADDAAQSPQQGWTVA